MTNTAASRLALSARLARVSDALYLLAFGFFVGTCFGSFVALMTAPDAPLVEYVVFVGSGMGAGLALLLTAWLVGRWSARL